MKTLILAAISLALFHLGLGAEAAQFGLDNKYTAVEIFGRIEVRCRDNPRPNFSRYRVYHTCRDWTLDPAEYDYFYHDSQKIADRFKLKSHQANGRVRSKEGGFNSKKGRSQDRVNLWVETLFQRALLDVGSNRIEFALLKGAQVQEEGEFTLEVNVGERRQCQRRSFRAMSPSDCDYPERFCWQYFNEANYCQ